MGAWDTGPFDNDDAGDFVAAVIEDGNGKFDEIFTQFILIGNEDNSDPTAYKEVDYDSALIALGAIIVAQENDDEIEEFEGKIPHISYTDDDLGDLIDRLEDILENPNRHEAYELWEDATPDHFAAWKVSLNTILSGLRALV